MFPFTDDEQLHLQGGSHIGSRASTVNLKVIQGLVLFNLTSAGLKQVRHLEMHSLAPWAFISYYLIMSSVLSPSKEQYGNHIHVKASPLLLLVDPVSVGWNANTKSVEKVTTVYFAYYFSW